MKQPVVYIKDWASSNCNKHLEMVGFGVPGIDPIGGEVCPVPDWRKRNSISIISPMKKINPLAGVYKLLTRNFLVKVEWLTILYVLNETGACMELLKQLLVIQPILKICEREHFLLGNIIYQLLFQFSKVVSTHLWSTPLNFDQQATKGFLS